MRYRVPILALLLTVWLPAANAEHAKINLRVLRVDAQSGKASNETTAAADEEPPAGGILPRPIFKAKVQEPLVLQFILTNMYSPWRTQERDGAVFRGAPGQTGAEKAARADQGDHHARPLCLALETQGPRRARLAFTIPEPGVYLVACSRPRTRRAIMSIFPRLIWWWSSPASLAEGKRPKAKGRTALPFSFSLFLLALCLAGLGLGLQEPAAKPGEKSGSAHIPGGV